MAQEIWERFCEANAKRAAHGHGERRTPEYERLANEAGRLLESWVMANLREKKANENLL